ncbi:MAG: hypothetical protein IJI41_08260 [Anaerolineaceae bacterium]|nr:hypothetical protein [Anaerolineaceae bacterium]
MAMKERRGRNRVSKAEKITGKIPENSVPTNTNGRSRVSKADKIAGKIGSNASNPTPNTPTRVRPVSKADKIAQKIGPNTNNPISNTPTRVRPSSKADEIGKKIPTNPAPAPKCPADVEIPRPSARVPSQNPAQKKSSGCCLLPFTLAITAIAAALVIIF